jgi:hypothetical protein
VERENIFLYNFNHFSKNILTNNNVRFQVFTAVTIGNAVFWDVMPCGTCKDRRLGGTSVLKEPYGVTSHKTAFFTVTAVKT